MQRLIFKITPQFTIIFILGPLMIIIFNHTIRIMKQKKTISRLNWLQEEQNYLKKLYVDQGVKSWKEIADYMKISFPNRSRTPKQYRERFTNYIRFEGQRAERDSWTADEDRIIFQKYRQLGSKWVQISKLTPRRSENNVKNRFYSALRKMVRRINVLLGQNKNCHNIRKPIKQTAIFKLLQTQQIITHTKDQEFPDDKSRQKFIFELKNDCLRVAMRLDGEIDSQLMYSIGIRLHKFNTITRFECLRKSRKTSNVKRKALPPVPERVIEIEQQDGLQSKQREETYEKTNKETEQIQQGGINEFIQVRVEQRPELYNGRYYDIQFEVCQILGMQYDPKPFYIL